LKLYGSVGGAVVFSNFISSVFSMWKLSYYTSDKRNTTAELGQEKSHPK
jgi:hypothetical protein